MGANAHSDGSPSQYGHELLIVMYFLFIFAFSVNTEYRPPYAQFLMALANAQLVSRSRLIGRIGAAIWTVAFQVYN